MRRYCYSLVPEFVFFDKIFGVGTFLSKILRDQCRLRRINAGNGVVLEHWIRFLGWFF